MRMRYAVPALAAAAVLLLSGCVDNSTPSAGSSGGASAPAIAVDEAAAALLPESVKTAGKLVIGIDPNYAPNEFKNDAGEPEGWAVDLANGFAAKLGLTTEYKASSFDKIIPSVLAGTFDIGYSSFTDNPERQKSVDFVNYYNAGIQWAQPVGGSLNIDDVCGLTVAVQRTTFQETDMLPAISETCVAGGKEAVKIEGYETQAEATNALAVGKADAMVADSPITQYAVAQQSDKIELAGEAFEVAPYGIAVDKGNTDLRDAIQAALQSMVDDGSYKEILSQWGVESGGIDTITINAGG